MPIPKISLANLGQFCRYTILAPVQGDLAYQGRAVFLAPGSILTKNRATFRRVFFHKTQTVVYLCQPTGGDHE